MDNIPDNGELRREMEEMLKLGHFDQQSSLRLLVAANRDALLRQHRLEAMMRESMGRQRRLEREVSAVRASQVRYPSLTYHWRTRRPLVLALLMVVLLMWLGSIYEVRAWMFYWVGVRPLPLPPGLAGFGGWGVALARLFW